MKKPETIIVDIDGTIFRHTGNDAVIQWGCSELLPRVQDFFDLIEKQGACIVLMTARKESAREETEAQLRACGLFWDHLIMGVTSGRRVIINDKKDTIQDSCAAFCIPRNQGLDELCRLYGA